MRIRNRTAATHADNLPRNDTNLSNMDQQGIWPPLEARCTHPLLQDPVLSACIHIDPLNSVNPDCDLHPTGQYEIFQSHSTSRDLPTTVDVHLPSGKLAGRLTRSRITALHTAFQKCAVSYPNMTRGTFSCEISNLLHRYNPGRKLAGQATLIPQHLWTTPTPVMTALQKNLGLTTERFASPLDYDPHMLHYYTPHEADRVFGANLEAFSTIW